MHPLVTIGIPCYNAARWLGAAVQSALDQTWPNKEIIVIDDGSTDDSLSVAQKFGDAIRIESGPNRGVNHARNRVLQLARGEWIQYVDSDDYLQPEKIARQFAEAEPISDADVIYSPVIYERWKDGVPGELEPWTMDTTRDVCWQLLAWQLPQTSGTLWRKPMLDSLGGWDEDPEQWCDEHDLYLRAIKAGARFRFAPTPGAVYRIWSEESRCHRNPRAIIRSRTAVIESLCEWMQQQGKWTVAHREIAGQTCFETARTFANISLAEATSYHARQRHAGLIHLAGPAAPGIYQIVYRALGFAAAERVAAFMRSKK